MRSEQFGVLFLVDFLAVLLIGTLLAVSSPWAIFFACLAVVINLEFVRVFERSYPPPNCFNIEIGPDVTDEIEPICEPTCYRRLRRKAWTWRQLILVLDEDIDKPNADIIPMWDFRKWTSDQSYLIYKSTPTGLAALTKTASPQAFVRIGHTGKWDVLVEYKERVHFAKLLNRGRW
jgi:hypothetical protein